MAVTLRLVQNASEPLTWDYWQWGATDLIQTAIMSCDKGHVGTASPAIHRIADDGTLSPSWVCPFEGCTWHEFAVLEDWIPNLLRPPAAIGPTEIGGEPR